MDPNYENLLIEIIEENQLYQYDKEDIMDTVVLCFGDADVFAAVLVSQKNKCPLMLYQDYKDKGLKADKVIQIGGPRATAAGSNRFETFQAASFYYLNF